MEKISLWKVTVNNWGWDRPKTIYATSRQEAEEIRSKYPAADSVEYAGKFTHENAMRLLGKEEY